MAHSLATRRKFFRYRERGYSIRQSADAAGVSNFTGKRWHAAGKEPTLAAAEQTAKAAAAKRVANAARSRAIIAATEADPYGDPETWGKLPERAQRGLTDFEHFRRVYLGHVSTPWQVEAANKLIELLATPDKEYVVLNEPPGSGKTTLLHDLAVWLTVRNRRVRGLVGSHTGSIAADMVGRIKDTLERTEPYKPTQEEIDSGLAVDAEATLAEDYGAFVPEKQGRWTQSKFRVRQPDGGGDSKESTWVAYGFDQGWLGGRFNVCFWDDANVPEQLTVEEKRERLLQKWDRQAESRLDPGGVLFLVGQRIAANDLYRHAVDKKRPLTEDDHEALDALSDEDREKALADRPNKYHHVVYRAHYDDRCRGKDGHGADAAPYPDGCLLDPRRLPWRELIAIRDGDPQTYATWYQQEDSDPEHALVKKVWVDGGTDPDVGSWHPGCWDADRDLCQLPSDLAGPLISVATIDPSPTRFWAFQWWVYAPEAGHRHFLMDSARRVMSADKALDGDPATGEFTGLMELWQARSVRLGLPIGTWVMEVNAAQRWFFDFSWAQRWIASRNVNVIKHTTTMMKSDPTFGIAMTRDHWKRGRIRLPGLRSSPTARTASLQLVNEVTRYPNSATDDQVMAHWFYFHHIDDIARAVYAELAPVVHLRRPSWAGSLPNARPLMKVAQ